MFNFDQSLLNIDNLNEEAKRYPNNKEKNYEVFSNINKEIQNFLIFLHPIIKDKVNPRYYAHNKVIVKMIGQDEVKYTNALALREYRKRRGLLNDLLFFANRGDFITPDNLKLIASDWQPIKNYLEEFFKIDFAKIAEAKDRNPKRQRYNSAPAILVKNIEEQPNLSRPVPSASEAWAASLLTNLKKKEL